MSGRAGEGGKKEAGKPQINAFWPVFPKFGIAGLSTSQRWADAGPPSARPNSASVSPPLPLSERGRRPRRGPPKSPDFSTLSGPRAEGQPALYSLPLLLIPHILPKRGAGRLERGASDQSPLSREGLDSPGTCHGSPAGRRYGCVSKWGRFFAFLADSSRALQACCQRTASPSRSPQGDRWREAPTEPECTRPVHH